MFRLTGQTCLALIQLPNGQLAATSGYNINIWSPLTNIIAPLATLSGHSNMVLALALSPNRSLLASGSQDNTIKLWSYLTQSTASNTFMGHTSYVRAVCFLSNQILASGSIDMSIKIWNVDSGIKIIIYF